MDNDTQTAKLPPIPKKLREIQTNHFDSTIWNDFKFRDDDVIVSTYGKSGTTWTQQILAQLLMGPDGELETGIISPWMDLRVPPKEVKLAEIEAQQHRRFVKTHLPTDALVFSEKAKYVYVGRDGRDVAWSLYNHHLKGNDGWYSALNDTPGLVGPKFPRIEEGTDAYAYYTTWFENDGYPFWPFWENIRSWWAIRDLPNVMMIHFSDMKADLEGEMRRIADFLDVSHKEEDWPTLVEYCTFDWMKRHGDLTAPLGGALWDGGSDSFLFKGVNRRWAETLSADEVALYESKAIEELGEDCANWLANGRLN